MASSKFQSDDYTRCYCSFIVIIQPDYGTLDNHINVIIKIDKDPRGNHIKVIIKPDNDTRDNLINHTFMDDTIGVTILKFCLNIIFFWIITWILSSDVITYCRCWCKYNRFSHLISSCGEDHIDNYHMMFPFGVDSDSDFIIWGYHLGEWLHWP
jgi:hypothetical protein